MHLAAGSALLFLALGGATAAQQAPAPAPPRIQPSPEAVDAIGQGLRRIAGTDDGFALLYAEFDDGWVGYQILQQRDGETEVRSPEGSDGDFGLVLMDAWDDAKGQLGDEVWLAMVYALDHGKFRVRLLYRGEFDPDADLGERARAAFDAARTGAAAGLR